MSNILHFENKKYPGSGKITGQMLNDEIATLVTAYVKDKIKTQEDAIEVIRQFMGAMVTKCAHCVAAANGRVMLADAAKCANPSCPLAGFGPPAFQVIQERLIHAINKKPGQSSNSNQANNP